MEFLGDVMDVVKVKIKLKPGAKIPFYATNGSVGADLYAYLQEPVVIPPLGRYMVPTGVFIELPVGYEAQIRPRSGLAAKHGLTLLNAPGTIDWDYRGEIKVILINLGDKPFSVEPNMRIAQMVINKVSRAEFVVVKELSSTIRGEGGFGHSGSS